MPLTIDVSMSESISENDAEVPDAESFQRWAEAAFLEQGQVLASLRIVDVEEMQTLNRTYRQQDKPTNVLSFPMELPEEVDIEFLGDLALCAPVIRDEAIEQHKPMQAHWAHMVVHGMLHLQGFDHVENDEAEAMEAKEITIMQSLGFDNPYL